jgi:diguanylate cyclase (GGDEF)-like protein
VTVNDVAVPPVPFNRAARVPGQAAAMIEVAADARERGFALEFAALDYSAPGKNHYAYRLLGFDPRWISADAGMRRISYNNLPPGSYTLQLRGSNRNGDWSPALEVPVRALPQWHQKTWVRVAFGLLGAILVVVMDQFRTGYLRRRQRELEILVDARTAELQASQRQLEIFAYSDPMTGLPNRRCFTDELRHMAARSIREKDNFTLLLIDLDHFKQINDTLGHDAGDAVLVEAARRLKLAVRESDRVARLGGDEFAVLLPRAGDESTVAVICLRIVASMAMPMPFGGQDVKVSASVGAASFGAADSDLDTLYKAADTALYETKRRGRNGWTWYRA